LLKLFKLQVQGVDKMALIDLYCNNDCPVANMEPVIADLALSNAEEILEVKNKLCLAVYIYVHTYKHARTHVHTHKHTHTHTHTHTHICLQRNW